VPDEQGEERERTVSKRDTVSERDEARRNRRKQTPMRRLGIVGTV